MSRTSSVARRWLKVSVAAAGIVTILVVLLFTSRDKSMVSFLSHSSVTPVSATATTTKNSGGKEIRTSSVNGDKVWSIPLIPHHVLKKRRRHLARLLKNHSKQRRKDLDEEANLPDGVREYDNRGGRPTRYDLRRRRRSLVSSDDKTTAEQVGALFQGYGTHYADIWVGTPPQRQTVIVDTGSGITAFPCSGCNVDCGVPDYHIDRLFNEADSSTFRTLTCNECLSGQCSIRQDECSLGQSYQEGSSWYAYEGSDMCYLGGLHNEPLESSFDSNGNDSMDPFHAPDFAFSLKFGCQTSLTGLFKTQLADGIMGMDTAGAAFWKQMYDAQKISNPAFSLCFSRSPLASREGTLAGAMSMGGCDTRLHNEDSPMLFAVNDNYYDQGGFNDFYKVDLRAIYLREARGGESAAHDPSALVVQVPLFEHELGRGDVIIDSGTSDTYLASIFAPKIYPIFEELAGRTYASASTLSTIDEVMEMPTFLFQFRGETGQNQAIAAANNDDDGTVTTGLAANLDPDNRFDVIVAMPPSHYYEYDDETMMYVNRLYMDESSGAVFGANFMMGHDVLFDNAQDRIGWAESNCEYTGFDRTDEFEMDIGRDPTR